MAATGKPVVILLPYRDGGHDPLHTRSSYGQHATGVVRPYRDLSDEAYASGDAYSQLRGEKNTPGLSFTICAGVGYNWM